MNILVTNEEEKGASTAKEFSNDAIMHLKDDITKQFNWLVQFDRRGMDVVTYGYTNGDWIDILHEYFCNVGNGSYTCIRELEAFGCGGVNIGVGYGKEHTQEAFIDFRMYLYNVHQFALFYTDKSETHYAAKNTIKAKKQTHVIKMDGKKASKKILKIRPGCGLNFALYCVDCDKHVPVIYQDDNLFCCMCGVAVQEKLGHLPTREGDNFLYEPFWAGEQDSRGLATVKAKDLLLRMNSSNIAEEVDDVGPFAKLCFPKRFKHVQLPLFGEEDEEVERQLIEIIDDELLVAAYNADAQAH